MQTLAHLGFKRYAPHPKLQSLVQCYWRINVPQNHDRKFREFMHPEGGTGIIYNFADPIYLNNQLVSQEAIITGPTSKTNAFTVTGKIDTLGIRFHPGSGHDILSLPLSELLDETITPQQIAMDSLGGTLQEQLAIQESDHKRVELLDNQLLSLLNDYYQPDNRLNTALSWIKQHQGQKPITKLTHILNLSQRQLDRHFKIYLGLLPKQFSRIQQVTFARNILKTVPQQTSLTDIAYQAGFYDQAHFIHQFKQVVGITPGAYRNKAIKTQI